MSLLTVRLETVIQMLERGLLCTCEINEKTDIIYKHRKTCAGRYRVKKLLSGHTIEVPSDLPGKNPKVKLER